MSKPLQVHLQFGETKHGARNISSEAEIIVYRNRDHGVVSDVRKIFLDLKDTKPWQETVTEALLKAGLTIHEKTDG